MVFLYENDDDDDEKNNNDEDEDENDDIYEDDKDDDGKDDKDNNEKDDKDDNEKDISFPKRIIRRENEQKDFEPFTKKIFNPNQESWSHKYDKFMNRAEQISKGLGQNIQHITTNLVDGPSRFIQGFSDVSGGFNELAGGIDQLASLNIRKGGGMMLNGLKKIPLGVIGMGVGGLKTSLGTTAVTAGIGGTGYLLKKAKDGLLYKIYRQKQQDKAKRGLSQIAAKILQKQGAQQFQKRYLPSIDRITGYTNSKILRGSSRLGKYGAAIVNEVDNLGQYVQDKAEQLVVKGYQGLKNKVKGGKFNKQQQKPAGILINVQQKGNNVPKHIDQINHKQQKIL